MSLVLRVYLLRTRPLWHDEAFTAWIARRSPSDLVATLREDSGPPLFYLLERPFALAAATPASDPLLRLLPLAASLALFAAAGSLPRGESRAWWIALCSGFTLVNIYAAEARAYALLALACLGVFLFGVVARETPRNLVALFAAAVSALWLHYLAIFAIAAGFLLAVAARRARAALVLVVSGATFVPWLPVLARQPAAALSWVREAPLETVLGFLSALGGMGRVPAPFGPTPPRAAFIATALVGAILVVVLGLASRGDPSVRAASLFVLVTLGLAFGASLGRPIAFAGRSEMAVLPVWMWGLAKAAPGRFAARVGAGLAAGLGLAATFLVSAGPHPLSVNDAAVMRVAKLSRRGDVLLAGPGFYLPALLVAERGSMPARVASIPPGDAAHPGWFVAAPFGPAEEAALEHAMSEVGPAARVFLLLPPAQDTPGIMRVLFSRGTVRELARQPDGVLLVWSPGAPDASDQTGSRRAS